MYNNLLISVILFALVAFVLTTPSTTVAVKGKNVLITGASSGIGKSLAIELAAKGLNVVLAARRKENLQNIVGEIEKAGGSAFAVTMDVGSVDSVKKGFKNAEAKFGPIDYTIANAGYDGEHLDITTPEGIAEIEKIFRVNVLGAAYTISEAILQARKAGGGAIIVVSSVAGSLNSGNLAGFPFNAFTFAYPGSKAAVDGFARSSVALLKENIRVYSLAPAVFLSEMLDSVTSNIGITAAEFSTMNPIVPTPGNPRDLAPVVLSIFDNTTLYSAGEAIICDNYVTFSAHEFHQQLYPGRIPAKVERDIAKDFQGKPYEWKKEL